MQRIQLNSKDGVATGWIGVGASNDLPERGRSGSPRAPRPKRNADSDDATPSGSSWLRAGLRFVQNAAIGLALLSVVPFAAIGILGGRFQRYEATSERVRARLESVEHLRSYRAPIDASITPEDAGLAFRALQPDAQDANFPMRASAVHHHRPWKSMVLGSTMFANVRNPTAPNELWTSQMLYAGSSELSAQELAYLRTVAEATIWQDFDRAASAGAVDMIGGQFELPFSEKAFAPAMPIMRFADMRGLANAAILRAAYYVAIRDLDRAEVTLKSLVSFGFVVMDNATSTVDAVLGRVIANTGGDGLVQLYTILMKEDLMMAARTPKEFPANDASRARQRTDARVLRARLLSEANNIDLPRGIRFESLRSLSMSSCSNVREVLMGPSPDVRDAFRNAKVSLARFPSEQAYLDLVFRTTERVPEDAGVMLAPERFIVGAAAVAGVVLNNPRVEACTRMAMLSY